MKKESMLLFIAFSISGCATVPKSSSELVETSSTTQTYCYSLPSADVEKKIEGLLSKCYGPFGTTIPIGAAYVPIRADFQVIHEKLPDGNRYSIRNFVGFAYSADVVSGPEACETEVQMYAVTGFWKKAFVAVDQAITGHDVKCP